MAQIAAIMLSWNAKSLDFYGKIIDQYGNPVEGVKVHARVGLVISPIRSGGKEYYTKSDSKGDFNFVGIHGAGMGLTLTKDGYIYDQSLPSESRPDDYIPDPNHPVIFKMWKLKGAEPMIYARIHKDIPCDGTQETFDLLARQGKGDLQITLTRNPVSIDRSKPFDWTLIIGLANGGLVENTDTYPYEAPAEGYQPSITITMPSDDKNWTPFVSKSYYFHNGTNYGRMTISIMADFQPPPTLFDAYIYANPSGSRDLEFDPSKQTNP